MHITNYSPSIFEQNSNLPRISLAISSASVFVQLEIAEHFHIQEFPIVSFITDQSKRVVLKTENVASQACLFAGRLSVSLIPATAENTELDCKYFQADLCVGYQYFHRNESFKVAYISGRPLSHGQRSSEERRPRKWYNNFRGGICYYTSSIQAKNLQVLFCFVFPQ